MSILSRNLLPNPTSRLHLFTSTSHTIPNFQSLNFYRISNPRDLPNLSHLQFLFCHPYTASACISFTGSRRWRIKGFQSKGVVEENQGPVKFNLDYFLSVSELTCLILSVGCLVYFGCFKHKNSTLLTLGNRVLVWLLAGSVLLGTAIRRRQWRRVCGVPVNVNVNVVERIGKLEVSLQTATTIIHVLSRQLEKLGIRFRVTRRTLKDPIAQTAALAQKNAEIASTLAAQEDRLEKELVEVQKVLLAMQDQQQKQLELILAIAKSGKLLGPVRDP